MATVDKDAGSDEARPAKTRPGEAGRGRADEHGTRTQDFVGTPTENPEAEESGSVPEAPVPQLQPASPALSWILWLSLAAVIVALVAAALLRQPPASLPPIYSHVPDFALIDQQGNPVVLADLLGEPWIVDFVFTRCPGICPRMSQQMAAVQAQLDASSKARLISISVDPEYDRPEVLAAYAQRYRATPRWRFLTGDRDAIFGLSQDGFKLPAQEAPPDSQSIEPIVHSDRFVLVDALGRIRGYYGAFDQQAQSDLLRDLRLLETSPIPTAP